MKLGIPVFHDRVSPVLDTATKLLIIEIQDGAVVSEKEKYFNDMPFLKRSDYLNSMGLDIIICGALSRPLNNLIVACGIKLMPWISGSVDEVIKAYQAGALGSDKFRMPGCCRRGLGYGQKKNRFGKKGKRGKT